MPAVATLPRRADEHADRGHDDCVEREQRLLAEVTEESGDEGSDDGEYEQLVHALNVRRSAALAVGRRFRFVRGTRPHELRVRDAVNVIEDRVGILCILGVYLQTNSAAKRLERR